MTCSSHKFVVIDHHRKALGTMLADERFYDAERLTAARSSDYPCSSETVAYLSLIHI